MRLTFRRPIRSLVAAVLVTAFVFPQNLVAQASQLAVSPLDLQNATVDASQARP